MNKSNMCNFCGNQSTPQSLRVENDRMICGLCQRKRERRRNVDNSTDHAFTQPYGYAYGSSALASDTSSSSSYGSSSSYDSGSSSSSSSSSSCSGGSSDSGGSCD